MNLQSGRPPTTVSIEAILKGRGALLGAACGDALGAPYEGMAGGRPPARPPERLAAAELRFTDDTAMTIGLAESLLEAGDLDEDHLAATLAGSWRAEPWRGYGRGASELFSELAAGGSWRTASRKLFGGEGSWGNGAAMRVSPLPIFAAGDLTRTVALARRSAVVTHAHPLAVDGAALQAAAIALGMQSPGDASIEIRPFVMRLRLIAKTAPFGEQLERVVSLGSRPSPDAIRRELGCGVDAVSSVSAAIAIALHVASGAAGDAMADAVDLAIQVGGDTDTIASMAAAITGAHRGAEAIPQDWIRRLEFRDRLVDIADRLVALSRPVASEA